MILKHLQMVQKVSKMQLLDQKKHIVIENLIKISEKSKLITLKNSFEKFIEKLYFPSSNALEYRNFVQILLEEKVTINIMKELP